MAGHSVPVGQYLPVDSEVGGSNLSDGKSLFLLTQNVQNDAEETRDKNWTRLNSLVLLRVCNCLGSCVGARNEERKEFDASIINEKRLLSDTISEIQKSFPLSLI